MGRLEEIIRGLETIDLEEWGNLTKELSNFGADAIETLGQELIKSLDFPTLPYIVVQSNPVIPSQEFERISKRFYQQPYGTMNVDGAIITNVRFNKLIAERGSVVQNTIGHNIIYAGEKAAINMVTADEVWVAPYRIVSYVYAKHILAGFPHLPNLLRKVFYETNDPAEGIIASGYNRTWGILDALTRIGDKRAIPYIQRATEKAIGRSNIIHRATLESIEKLKGFI